MKESIPQDYFPILLQSIVALGFVVVTMTVSHFIAGKRRKFRTLKKDENFECGIEIQGNARFPFSVKYFLIAILFVLFDVEIIFFYPWAVNYVKSDLNYLLGMLVFIAFVFAGLWYIIKKGALDWNKQSS